MINIAKKLGKMVDEDGSVKDQHVTPMKTQYYDVINIIYNDGQFAVSIGYWKVKSREKELRIGVRWHMNGKAIGTPQYNNKPTWLVLPSKFSHAMLRSLIGMDDVDENSLIESLKLLRG